MSYKKEEINESRLVGEMLRQERKKKGMSAQDIADKMGYSVRSIFYWETGAQIISLEQLYGYCEILCVDPLNIMPCHRKDRQQTMSG